MLKILKYLRESKAAVIAIILLLILQAYGDLSLPGYTSRIVDVGIQQGGIERAVPEAVRESRWNQLTGLMTSAERETVSAAYERISAEELEGEELERYSSEYPVLGQEAVYVLTEEDSSSLDQLEEYFAFPMVILSSLQTATEEGGEEGLSPEIAGLLAGLSGADGEVTASAFVIVE